MHGVPQAQSIGRRIPALVAVYLSWLSARGRRAGRFLLSAESPSPGIAARNPLSIFMLIFHLFIGGIFMIALCRHSEISPYASLLAAVVFIANGFIFSYADLITLPASFSLFPAAALLSLKAIRSS